MRQSFKNMIIFIIYRKSYQIYYIKHNYTFDNLFHLHQRSDYFIRIKKKKNWMFHYQRDIIIRLNIINFKFIRYLIRFATILSSTYLFYQIYFILNVKCLHSSRQTLLFRRRHHSRTHFSQSCWGHQCQLNSCQV